MSGVRVLVGTKKGAFILTSDERRTEWAVSGPHFGGWEIYHLKGSSIDPNRIYMSQSTGWFGQLIQRSDDGGETWTAVGNEFVYEGVPGTHQWYDGTQHPWEFTRAGISSRRPPTRTRSTLGWRMRRCFAPATAGRRGKSFPDCARPRASVAAGRGWHVPPHHRTRPSRRRPHRCGDLRCGNLSHRRWRPDLATDQPWSDL